MSDQWLSRYTHQIAVESLKVKFIQIIDIHLNTWQTCVVFKCYG